MSRPFRPEIEITELCQDLIKFTLSGVHPIMANALRRVMIAEVFHCIFFFKLLIITALFILFFFFFYNA